MTSRHPTNTDAGASMQVQRAVTRLAAGCLGALFLKPVLACRLGFRLASLGWGASVRLVWTERAGSVASLNRCAGVAAVKLMEGFVAGHMSGPACPVCGPLTALGEVGTRDPLASSRRRAAVITI